MGIILEIASHPSRQLSTQRQSQPYARPRFGGLACRFLKRPKQSSAFTCGNTGAMIVESENDGAPIGAMRNS